METWYLIIIMYKGGMLSTQYTNKTACLEAAQTIQESLKDNVISGYRYVSYACVKDR